MSSPNEKVDWYKYTIHTYSLPSAIRQAFRFGACPRHTRASKRSLREVRPARDHAAIISSERLFSTITGAIQACVTTRSSDALWLRRKCSWSVFRAFRGSQDLKEKGRNSVPHDARHRFLVRTIRFRVPQQDYV